MSDAAWGVPSSSVRVFGLELMLLRQRTSVHSKHLRPGLRLCGDHMWPPCFSVHLCLDYWSPWSIWSWSLGSDRGRWAWSKAPPPAPALQSLAPGAQDQREQVRGAWRWRTGLASSKWGGKDRVQHQPGRCRCRVWGCGPRRAAPRTWWSAISRWRSRAQTCRWPAPQTRTNPWCWRKEGRGKPNKKIYKINFMG